MNIKTTVYETESEVALVEKRAYSSSVATLNETQPGYAMWRLRSEFSHVLGHDTVQ